MMKHFLKRLFLFIMLFVLVALGASAKVVRYAQNSVLSTGKWVKIGVSQSGYYKITYDELLSMGITSPANVAIYGYGGKMLEEDFSLVYDDDLPEVAYYMYKGSDGVFNSGDYIVFYGQGVVSWKYDGEKFVHKTNVYSTEGYYFLTSSLGEGKKIGMRTRGYENASPERTITTFTDYFVHEVDEHTLAYSGKEFYGELFNNSNQSYSFTVPTPNRQSGNVRYTISAIAKCDVTSTMTTSVGGKTIHTLTFPTLPISENIIKAKSAFGTQLFDAQAGNNLLLNLRYSKPNNSAWLNYFEINYDRGLKKESGSVLQFRNNVAVGENSIVKYQLQGLKTGDQVWNVSDKSNIQNIAYNTNGGVVEFVDSVDGLQEYVVINPHSDQLMKPRMVGNVANQNLHSLANVDMLIISNVEFVEQSERLASWHSQNEGMNVVVVDDRLIFNEFSSGTPDATAYRRFAKMLYDGKANDGRLKYLLLFGDGSFDNRKLMSAATEKNLYRLLTYQSDYSLSSTNSYSTDDYFGLLGDEDGKNIVLEDMDISVGRIPAYTLEHATNVVDKLIKYMNNTQYGTWKNRMLFMADDGDGNEHVSSADTVANLTQNLFSDMEIKKVYLDAYNQEVTASGASYPTAKKEFSNYIKEGVMLINYMGHGGYNGWSDEQILSSSDIENMYNENYALWVTATCDFSRFDDFKDSGGERLLYNPNGGAMGLFTTSRTVYAGPNKNLNLRFMKSLLSKNSDGEYVTIGEAVRLSKNTMKGDVNRMSFILLGNPAMKLNLPITHKVTIDSINGKEYHSDVTDTIRALQEVTLSGSLVTEDGTKDASFNGIIHLTVYDKTEKVTTLCNDAGSKPFTYLYRNSVLFSGSAVVENGQYTTTFRLPKDIRYNFGSARIVTYAYDEENGYEGNGATDKIVVGGEDENIVYENEGPEVEMYMNTSAFRDGDEINTSPLFVAKVYDESGINTVGSGIGHDMILRLNDDSKMEYNLNSYYKSVVGNYKSGEVTYKLNDLPYGEHTLLFRVWDLQNNSTVSTLKFVVGEEVEPILYSVVAWPNPATDVVYFNIKHNRPSVLAEVNVDVYDLSGSMVWSSGEQLITDNSGNSVIEWRLEDGSGRKVGKGLYLSKLTFVDENGEVDIKTVKLIVN